jgi:hypothetical protein
MKTGLIIDFETMGKDSSKCAVIDMAAYIFDTDKFVSDNPYTINDARQAKRFKLAVRPQVQDLGYTIDKDTLDFWQEQELEVRSKIAPRDDDLSVSQFTNQFLGYLNESPKIDYWWSRSNTFDPIILTRLYDSQGSRAQLESKLKYWKVRDLRTFIDAKLNFPKINGFCPFPDQNDEWEQTFKAHDSSWDVFADVLRLQAIARAEEDLEQVKL